MTDPQYQAWLNEQKRLADAGDENAERALDTARILEQAALQRQTAARRESCGKD